MKPKTLSNMMNKINQYKKLSISKKFNKISVHKIYIKNLKDCRERMTLPWLLETTLNKELQIKQGAVCKIIQEELLEDKQQKIRLKEVIIDQII